MSQNESENASQEWVAETTDLVTRARDIQGRPRGVSDEARLTY